MPKVIIDGRGDLAVDDVDAKVIWYTLGLDDEYLELHVNCTQEGLIFDLINVDGDVIDTLCHTVEEYVCSRLEADLERQRSELVDPKPFKCVLVMKGKSYNYEFATAEERRAFWYGLQVHSWCGGDFEINSIVPGDDDFDFDLDSLNPDGSFGD